jgi:TonB family protein
MADTWKQWEGHSVNGKFPLLRYLGGSEQSAVFLTERRVDGRLVKAAIKLAPAGSENGDLQLARWQLAAGLMHPHLIPLYETGRCELDGMALLYAVMEHAEESLAQVLPERALAPEEVHGMIESVLDALAYLHSKGFVHGHIKPANILASGDQLKITGDGLCRVGDLPLRPGFRDAHDPPEYSSGAIASSRTMAPAGDVWSLGMTLVEALTQNLPTIRMDEQQGPALPQILPEPFRDIASHCLLRQPQNRWTVAQIAARLKGRPPAPEVRAAPLPQARVQARAPRPVTRQTGPQAWLRKYATPLAVGLALVLAAIVGGPDLLRRHSEPPQAPAVAETQPLAPPALSQQAMPQKPATKKAVVKSLDDEKPSPNAPVPVPAAIHNEIVSPEAKDAVAKVPSGNFVQGKVSQRVDPEVLESARRSIRGTVKVVVRVDVDKSGNVENADFESRGPSKYFARAALEAAKLWKFNPPELGNRGVLSSWTLRFEFTRDGTNIVPIQEAP